MSNVIQFLGQQEREWRFLEDEIRQRYSGAPFDEAVVEDSLPAIKEHWKTIFESVKIQAPAVEIPGPLTDAQISAIKDAGKATADAFISRIKRERSKALASLIKAEVMLAYFRRHGVPPDAR